MSFASKKRFFLLATIVFLCLSLVFFAAHFFILRFLVDPTTGFISEHSIYPNLFLIFFALCSLILLILSAIFRPSFVPQKDRKKSEEIFPIFDRTTPPTLGSRIVFSRDSVPCIFASSFLGFSFLTFSVLQCVEYETLSLLNWVTLAFSFLSGFYFLFQFSAFLPLYSKRRALFSLLPVIWGGLKLVNCFIVASRSATGEYHNWEILTIAAIVLFFYVQSKFNLPRKIGYQYQLLFSIGLIASSLTLLYSLATLLLSSFWIYTSHNSLYELVLDLAVCLYILVYHFSSLKALRALPAEELLLNDGEAETAVKIEVESK